MKLSAPLLALALALSALPALLDPGVAAAAPRHRSHVAGPSYPMKAEEFRALMEKRIDNVRAVIDKKLDKRGVSADRKKAIHKIFDESSKDLRAEIARVTADGNVTQSEADKVKALTIGLRGKVRERLRAEKNPPASRDEPKKDKAKEPAAGKKPGHHDGEPAPSGAGAKTADAAHKVGHDGGTPHSPGGHTKATAPRKKTAGPTKPAKESPGKKRKKADPDPGANL